MDIQTAIAQAPAAKSSDIDWQNEMMLGGKSVRHSFIATRKQVETLALCFGTAVAQEQETGDDVKNIFNLGLVSAPYRGKSHFSDMLIKHGGRFQLRWRENEHYQFEGYSEIFGSVAHIDGCSGNANQTIQSPDLYAKRHSQVYKGLDIVEHPWMLPKVKGFHTLVKITADATSLACRRYEFFITPELERKPSFQGFIQNCSRLSVSG